MLLLVAEVAALTMAHATETGAALPPTTFDWFTPLLGWDAEWYLRIAATGYHWDAAASPSVQQSVVFFPLYPFLVRLANLAVGGRATLLPATALVLSSLFAVSALGLLHALVNRDFGRTVARSTVWYYLVFPVSFFLTAAYSESLFLLALVGSVLAARRGRWLLAGFAAAAATVTRPYGILVMLPLAYEYVAQRREVSARIWIGISALWLTLPVLALGGWMAYLYALTGDALVFIHAQVAWGGQRPTLPFETLLTGYGRSRDQQLQGRIDLGVLQFGIALLATIATIASWRTMRLTYALLATVFTFVVLSAGQTVSIWRYLYPIFPLFVVAAQAGQRSLTFDRAYVATALTLSGVFIAVVATGWSMIA